MSVIIRLQNLPWSANALDIRNFFRGLSIPEGGVHIVGGEQGDAFIAFSTDEDARQGMMLNGGKIKEVQVQLLLSSRSEMHKVIEAARQTVPILSLTAPAPAPVQIPQPTVPQVTTFSATLNTNPLASFGIPGLGNLQEIPQPAVIEPPAPLISPNHTDNSQNDDKEDSDDRKRNKERERRRSRSRSRSRDRKDRKRDRRDRSRSRERRRRDRSRSRDRRDRKRDRKDRSRSRDRTSRDKASPRRSRDNRVERKSPPAQNVVTTTDSQDAPPAPPPPQFAKIPPQVQQMMPVINSPSESPSRFNDPQIVDTLCKLQELGKKRNPNAFQGDQQNGSVPPRLQNNRGPVGRGGSFRREGRSSSSRFDEPQTDCCVAIRNAPNHTSYGDVRRFFPFMIDKHGIKMINDNMGRRTGTIYVRFCDNRSKQISLERKMNELKGANVIVESLEDSEYDSAVDSFLPFREDNGDPPAHAIPDEEPQPIFSVLKLTDLPLFVKEHDIIKAFNNFSLLSIVLNDCRSTRSKTAYIQFAKPDDARVALQQKENYVFGRRQATVEPVSDQEYDGIRIAQNDRIAEPTQRAPEMLPEVQVPRDPRQRRQIDNGNGQIAHQMKNHTSVAPAFIPNMPANFPQNAVFASPFAAPVLAGFPGPGAVDPRTAAANWANRPAFPNPMVQPPQQMPMNLEDEVLDCVLMKGLPSGATDRTIVTFLSDTGAVPARIHLMLDTNGLPSGDCFCEFRSPQEARKAATKHGHNLEGCRITVDLVSHTVVEEALEGPKINEQRETLAGNQPFFDSQRGGFAPRGQYRGRGGSDRSFDRGGYRGGYNGYDSSRGRGGFDGGRGSYRGRGNWNDRGGHGGFDRGRGRGYPRGRGGYDGGRDYDGGRQFENQNIQPEPDSALENFGAPGCVVSMENVPFRASIDEIMDFFGEFELTQDDVIRRYNERGQPTGDARVAFRTPFDAQRAIKTKHMNSIHERRVSLTLL